MSDAELPNQDGGVNASEGSSTEGAAGRQSWLVPAAAGLVAGLVVALVVIALTGGDEADAPTSDDAVDTTPLRSTVETDPSVADTATASSPDTTLASDSTVAEPDAASTTLSSDTTQPDTVPTSPATTVSANGIPIASDGFVRVFDDEYPIVRRCVSAPFAGYQVTSYVYAAGTFIDAVEQSIDEGVVGASWTAASDSTGYTDFGDDGFGLIAIEGDLEFPVSVNPSGTESEECPGLLTETDPTNPDFPITRSLLDVCFGDVAHFDDDGSFVVGLGYRGIISEGGEFRAFPNADDSLALEYDAPEAAFSGTDPAATIDDVDGGFELRGTAAGDPGGIHVGESREIVVEVAEALVRDCPPLDD